MQKEESDFPLILWRAHAAAGYATCSPPGTPKPLHTATSSLRFGPQLKEVALTDTTAMGWIRTEG